MVELRLFGSYHINRLGVVTDDLESFAGDVDAFMVEYPEREEDFILNSLKLPLFFLGTQLGLLLLQGPAMVLANRDLRSTEYSAAQRVAGERNVHNVDRSPFSILTDRGRYWSIANWLLFLLLAYLSPLSMAVAVLLGLSSFGVMSMYFWLEWTRTPVILLPVLGVIGWGALITGYLNFLVFAVLGLSLVVMVLFTFSERNETIISNIESLAAEHGYDEVSMVTGKAHVPALIDVVHKHGGGVEVSGVFYQKLFRHGEEKQLDEIETKGGRRHVEPAMETAGDVLLRRAAATLIDWTILINALYFVGVLFATTISYAGIDDNALVVHTASLSVSVWDLFWLVIIPLLLLYHPFMEVQFGRSVGKYVLGLVVVEGDGGCVTLRSALIRWLFRPIDFLPSFYFFGAVVSVFSDDGQRIGDHVAGTTVTLTKGRHFK